MSGQISYCRICNSKNIEKFLSLGKQPWCNDFRGENSIGKEEKYPLELFFCQNCSLVQLGFTLSKETMFVEHPYLSGTTSSLSKHFEELAKKVIKNFNLNKNDFVIDIGSNDGTLLKFYKKMNIKVLGIESGTIQAKIANEQGIETLNSFFNEDTADLILQKFGSASVISAAGVFFHLEELHSVVKGIKKLLNSQGIFVIQVIYLPEMIEKLSFDNIYHEHLVYYSLKTLQYVLELYDLEVFDVERSRIHGGTLIVYASHKTSFPINQRVHDLENFEQKNGYNTLGKYCEFAKTVLKIKDELSKILWDLKRNGKTIYGYGAPAKGNTLLNFCQIDKKLLDLLVEKNTLKCNLHAPGSGLKVVHESKIKKLPDYYLVLAWNFLDEFIKKESNYLSKGGKFIVPIPQPKIIP